MAIKRVKQESDSGCFVAAVAMLSNYTYDQAFKKIFPGEWRTPYSGGLMLTDAAATLRKRGWKIRKVPIKYIASLKKDALILITWDTEPDLSHALVYDAENKKIIDPSFDRPLRNRTYERMLHSVYYIEQVPKEKKS